MRLPIALAGLLYLLVSQAQYVTAGPLVPKDELQRDADWIKHLFDRQAYCGGQYCGISSQYCCTGGSTCYTDAQTIARCGAPTSGDFAAQDPAGWVVYTTTIVMPELITVVSTISSFVGVATTQNIVQSTAICTNAYEQACGAICCESASFCYASGKCTASSGLAAPTTSPSAPLRQTSGTTTVTAVVSVSVSTTQTFVPAASTAAQTGNGTVIAQTSTSGGLSGGAIAGIVVGVLAGIVLLILVCFCCILKTGFDVILGLFGLRNNRRKERVEVTEERYSRHGSASSRRDTHTGWFGGGGRSTRTEKKKSGLGEVGILASIALGLAGLWALLGLRRRSKEKSRPPRSDVSYSYYSDSYSGTGTSESEFPWS
jgi:hypothetical protein